jgi:hypothetical protein
MYLKQDNNKMKLTENYKKRLQELGGISKNINENKLPEIEWNGKRYYVDARLKQMRSISSNEEPIEFINLDDMGDQEWDSLSPEAKDVITNELIRVGAY